MLPWCRQDPNTEFGATADAVNEATVPASGALSTAPGPSPAVECIAAALGTSEAARPVRGTAVVAPLLSSAVRGNVTRQVQAPLFERLVATSVPQET